MTSINQLHEQYIKDRRRVLLGKSYRRGQRQTTLKGLIKWE